MPITQNLFYIFSLHIEKTWTLNKHNNNKIVFSVKIPERNYYFICCWTFFSLCLIWFFVHLIIIMIIINHNVKQNRNNEAWTTNITNEANGKYIKRVFFSLIVSVLSVDVSFIEKIFHQFNKSSNSFSCILAVRFVRTIYCHINKMIVLETRCAFQTLKSFNQ